MEPGQQVGSYRVVRHLGEGGMGSVFEAVHDSLGRRAAIKVLHVELSHNPQMAQRFFNEARAVTLIDHPGMVQVFDFGHTSDGAAYIVMEYLAGESLTTRIGRLGPGHVDEVLRLGRQIASGLAATHQKGIVHRDLKPDNIMIVADAEAPAGERAKILDFGIAKITGGEGGPLRTSTHLVMGTPAYMAPEQCQGAAGVTDKADVYALGVVLFQMLAGRLPFEQQDTVRLLHAHVVEVPPVLTELAPDAPAELEALVGLMLEKDPAHRPAMAEVVRRLERLGAPGSRLQLPPLVRREPPSSWSRAGTWVAGVGVVAALAGGGVVAARRVRGPAHPPPPPVVVGDRGGTPMAKKPAVAVDVRKAYAQALTRGRRQAQKGDLDAAVATFQAALSLSPNDGRVLSELGVVAQRQGDLALAEKWTRQSIAATSDPQVRGASLYNLGRIEEARGDNAAAVEAYKRSLQSRPNHLVRARLATLDPTAAAELDPFAPRLMAGPFPSVSAWCGQQLGAVKKERQGELRDDDFACDTDGDDSTWRATRLGGPWAEARIVVTRTAEVGNRDEEYHVAVRQADQWYVSPSLWSTTDGERHETNVGLLRFEVGDVVAGGAPQLTVHARVEESSYGGWGSSETERELLAFVGVGPSGRPSASAPIAVASRVTEDGVSPFDGDGRDDPRTTAYKLGWRVQPSGEIELSLGEHEGKLDPGLTADVLGTHRILFP